jgi:hypothetical protein
LLDGSKSNNSDLVHPEELEAPVSTMITTSRYVVLGVHEMYWVWQSVIFRKAQPCASLATEDRLWRAIDEAFQYSMRETGYPYDSSSKPLKTDSTGSFQGSTGDDDPAGVRLAPGGKKAAPSVKASVAIVRCHSEPKYFV